MPFARVFKSYLAREFFKSFFLFPPEGERETKFPCEARVNKGKQRGERLGIKVTLQNLIFISSHQPLRPQPPNPNKHGGWSGVFEFGRQ